MSVLSHPTRAPAPLRVFRNIPVAWGNELRFLLRRARGAGWGKDVIRRNKNRVELNPTHDFLLVICLGSNGVFVGLRNEVAMEPMVGRPGQSSWRVGSRSPWRGFGANGGRSSVCGAWSKIEPGAFVSSHRLR